MSSEEELGLEEFREKATEATLCFVMDDNEILLIEKKRGVGEGLYNGPGGKVEKNESIEECAIREVKEETRIDIQNVEKIGELEFIFGQDPFMFVHVFTTSEFSGEIEETEEARPEWFSIENIPLNEMWPDDKYWIPKMLNGEKFLARFYFDEEGDKILNHSFEDTEFT